MKLSPTIGWFTAALMFSSLAACQKKPTASTFPQQSGDKIVSAEPSSFDAIAKNLDAGGGMYLYFSTETFLKTASEKWAALVPGFVASGKLDEDKKTKALAAWETLAKVATRSGLKEISGFGASSIALEPGYYQTKWMVHHYANQANGLLWKLTSATPNAVDFVSYLPETTALATSGNLNLLPIWNALNEEAATNADLKKGIETITQQFQTNAQLNLPALIASLGPNYSMLITLDERRQTSLPIASGTTPLSIPEPGIAICVQVQDDVLINRLEQELSKNPMVVKSEEAGFTLRTFNLPIPMPFVRPTVAWKKGLLVIASSDGLIREMAAIQTGKKPGLAANVGFKKLMAGLPASGCNFGYVAPVLQKTASTLQMAQLSQDKTTDPAIKQLMEGIYKMSKQKAVCSVTQQTAEGWVGVSHENATPAAK